MLDEAGSCPVDLRRTVSRLPIARPRRPTSKLGRLLPADAFASTGRNQYDLLTEELLQYAGRTEGISSNNKLRREHRMRERYLGDSFDIVKRLWVAVLSPVAPMFAHERFIPQALRERFTALTQAPIYPGQEPAGPFSLLLDPHTGIPLPDAADQRLRISHTPLQFIVDLFEDQNLSFIACFDQTARREAGLPVLHQLDAKREHLNTNGISSFYYVSHAPFLFASRSADTLTTVRNAIINIGIPEHADGNTRLQTL